MSGDHEHSYGRYQALLRRGEKCPGCSEKARDYQREFRRANSGVRQLNTARNGASRRAFQRLAERYPIEFRKLLREELLKMYDERTRT